MVITVADDSLRRVSAGGKGSWTLNVAADAPSVKLSFSVTTGPDAENAPEWDVILHDSMAGELWIRNNPEISVDLPGKNAKEFKLEVICPDGARYGDCVTVEITEISGGQTVVFEAMAQQSIKILKTQIDQEASVARDLYSKERANQGEKDIYAILSPAGLRGYVFVEGMDTDRLREKTRDIKKARAFIDGETDIEEISPYLTPMSAVVGIVEGDIVELINGPFKGEKARVQQIDQGKEEITVELIEAMVPIPVTVKGDSVRVLEKEK